MKRLILYLIFFSQMLSAGELEQIANTLQNEHERKNSIRAQIEEQRKALDRLLQQLGADVSYEIANLSAAQLATVISENDFANCGVKAELTDSTVKITVSDQLIISEDARLLHNFPGPFEYLLETFGKKEKLLIYFDKEKKPTQVQLMNFTERREVSLCRVN